MRHVVAAADAAAATIVLFSLPVLPLLLLLQKTFNFLDIDIGVLPHRQSTHRCNLKFGIVS